MSELRKKLDVAKAVYESARYPGDLAEQLLAHQGRGWFRFVLRSAATIGSIAAMVGIIWLTGHFMSHPTNIDQSQHAITNTTGNTPAAEAQTIVELAVPGLPEMPSATPLVPMFESSLMLPAMPSLWANDLEQQQETPTTREAL